MRQITELARWLRSVDGLAYLALMLVALVTRVYLAPQAMVSNDLQAYEFWGEVATQHLFHVYSVGAQLSPNWAYIPAYPPLSIYMFGAIDAVYFGLGAFFHIPLLHDPGVSHMLRLVLKAPAILADLALLTIMYVKALKVVPRWVAWLLCITYAFSPGVIITVLFWGQTDGIVLLLVVLGLLFALHKQPVWCGIAFALCVNFKPEPIVFVPLALVYLWRWGSFRQVVRGAVAFIAVTVVAWAPYLIPPFGEISALKHNISIIEAAEGLTASHDAWNMWTVLNLQAQSVLTPYVGPFTLSEVGYGLFAVIILIALIGVWRDNRQGTLWAAAALIALGFYTVGTLQFERYLFPAVGLFFLAALYDRRYWIPYVAVSVSFTSNFGSALFYHRADPYTIAWSPTTQAALLLHLDGWQTGFINCVTLLVAIGFYLWPAAARAAQRGGVFRPSFGLEQTSPQFALVGVGGAVGAGHGAAVTRPVSDDPFAPFPASVALPYIAAPEEPAVSTGVQPDTLRTRAISPTQTLAQGKAPTLRLHPRDRSRPPYVSVVIPCYNEAGNIRPMYERLSTTLRQITPRYEIVFVNNGSYDTSPAILDDLAARDSSVSVVTLSRNFGSQGAYTAGYAYASGDCVVGLDGDIQDPPELIGKFVEKWYEGYDVVYGERVKRKGSLPRRIGYKLFYRVLRRLSYIDMPLDASDFALLDRRVVNVLNDMPERSRLLRGLRAYAGFSQTGIPYVRQERYSGITTNSFLGLFRWASLGIISFSFAPLDLISYVAGSVVVLTGIAIVVYTALYFITPGAPRGYETLLLVVLFLGAVQLLCLSIIGAYLGKIFEEVKARPRYLVADIQNNHHQTPNDQTHHA